LQHAESLLPSSSAFKALIFRNLQLGLQLEKAFLFKFKKKLFLNINEIFRL